jgi:hypothetical protein
MQDGQTRGSTPTAVGTTLMPADIAQLVELAGVSDAEECAVTCFLNNLTDLML